MNVHYSIDVIMFYWVFCIVSFRNIQKIDKYLKVIVIINSRAVEGLAPLGARTSAATIMYWFGAGRADGTALLEGRASAAPVQISTSCHEGDTI